MRFGVLSDVHGNLHALRAVVAALDGHGVDGYLCTGDLVGYGPHPDACVELVAELGAHCVAGNHDLHAVGALDDGRAGVLARQTLAWTREVMSGATRAFLAALPLTRTVDGLLLAHGSPTDPQEYVRTEERAWQVLDDVTEPRVQGVLLGHTHHQWAVVAARPGELLRRRTGRVDLPAGARYLLNPGSVGQSRDGDTLARYLVLDTAARSAAFHAVGYDIAGCRAALRRAGLPVRGIDATDRSLRELARG
ncbi:MAG: metallophosphoesterase family protein, partial [Mycobacteriales bacterium]